MLLVCLWFIFPVGDRTDWPTGAHRRPIAGF